MPFNTRFSPEYSRFRDLLDYAHLRNLWALLMNLEQQGALKEGQLQSVQVGPPLEAIILIELWQGELWLLAGHWLRHGEPTAKLLHTVARYREALHAGREVV